MCIKFGVSATVVRAHPLEMSMPKFRVFLSMNCLWPLVLFLALCMCAIQVRASEWTDLIKSGQAPAKLNFLNATGFSKELLDAANQPTIFVAISASMPPENLKKLARDAGRANVTLVLRGFVEGSVQKTTEAMAQYARLGASIQIYPQLFSQYGITVVPTYLAVKSTSECLANTQCTSAESATVSGDVSLAYALRSLQKTVPTTLQTLLAEKLALLGERP